MKKKLLAAGAVAIMLSMVTVSGGTVLASEDKETTSLSKETDQNKKEDGKSKMEAALKKWEALSEDKKNEVYKIVEEKQAVDGKLLDKFASLGIMDQDQVTQMKDDMKQILSELKESGKMPMRGGPKGPKDGCKGNQDSKQKQ